MRDLKECEGIKHKPFSRLLHPLVNWYRGTSDQTSTRVLKSNPQPLLQIVDPPFLARASDMPMPDYSHIRSLEKLFE